MIGNAHSVTIEVSAANLVLHMQMTVVASLLFMVLASPTVAVHANPVEKVVQLLSALEVKITVEGEAEARDYKALEDWCDDSSTNFKLGELEAAIADSLQAKTDLEAATQSREKEHASFAIAEAELVDSIHILDHAIAELEQEEVKNPASIEKEVPTTDVQIVIENLNAIISSFALPASDRKKLDALVQEKLHENEGNSLPIIDIIEHIKWRTGEELAETRRIDASAQRKFNMFKRSLDDSLDGRNLTNAEVALRTLTTACKAATENHETSMKNRTTELKTISQAKKIITESTRGAQDEVYSLLESEWSSSATSTKSMADDKIELQVDNAKVTSTFEDAVAESTNLKEMVAKTQKELADLKKAQEEMDVARKDEHAQFAKAKINLEHGIAGVQEALHVLRNYYGPALLIQGENQQIALLPTHSRAEGAGSSIIAILEVVLSDFSKSLAEENTAEEDAESVYEETTRENKITRSTKEQDLKYIAGEAVGLHSVNKDRYSEASIQKQGHRSRQLRHTPVH